MEYIIATVLSNQVLPSSCVWFFWESALWISMVLVGILIIWVLNSSHRGGYHPDWTNDRTASPGYCWIMSMYTKLGQLESIPTLPFQRKLNIGLFQMRVLSFGNTSLGLSMAFLTFKQIKRWGMFAPTSSLWKRVSRGPHACLNVCPLQFGLILIHTKEI